MAVRACKYYRPQERGGCRNGAACQFLHAEPSMAVCKFFAKGNCTVGAACRYVHSDIASTVATERWEHCARGTWHPFPAQVNTALEAADLAGQQLITFSIGGESYEADLWALKQTCVKDPSRIRMIRRAPDLLGAESEIGKWEAQVKEVERELQAWSEPSRGKSLWADDMLSQAAEGLDSLRLSGPLRERRRVVLEQIQRLEEQLASLASFQPSEVAARVLQACEGEIAEARSMLSECRSSTDAEAAAAQKTLAFVDDVVFQIMEKLDCLELSGEQRVQRRSFLQQLEDLGAHVARQRAEVGRDRDAYS